MKTKTGRTERAAKTSRIPLKAKGATIIQRWGLLMVTGLALLMAIVTFDPRIDPEADSVDYIVLGKAISSGQGMRYIHLPEAPKPDKFPAGLPLLLSGVEWVAPDSIIARKALVAACYVGSMMLFFRLASTYVSPLTAFWLTLLVTINPFILAMARTVMSEIPYLFFSLVALWLLERILDRPESFHWGMWGIGMATLLFAAQIRTVGWTLLLSLLVVLLLHQRHRKLAIAMAAGCVLLVAAGLLAGIGPIGSRYLAIWGERMSAPEMGGEETTIAASRIVSSGFNYVYFVVPATLFPLPFWRIPVTGTKILPPIMAPGSLGTWAFVVQACLSLLCLLIVLLGTWPSLQGRRLTPYYMAASMGILLAWPAKFQWARLLVPSIPFLFLFSTIGLQRLWVLVWPRWPALYRAAPILIGVLVSAHLWGSVSIGVLDRNYSPVWAERLQLAQWIQTHTDTNALILIDTPAHLYVLSGRPSDFLLRDRRGDGQEFTTLGQTLEYIDRSGAEYLIDDGTVGRLKALKRELVAYVEQPQSGWRVAYRGAGTAVYTRGPLQVAPQAP